MKQPAVVPSPHSQFSAPVKVFWTTRDWANAIAALPVDGPLPARTALVPRERVALALRRELLRVGRPDVLAGTRFLTPVAAAIEVLRAAGVAFEPGAEALRPARLLALFRRGLPLEHFPLDLLTERPGWAEAFARTLEDLEATGLRPDTLAASESARLRDVAAIWRAVDELSGGSWTRQRISQGAALALERRPEGWPFTSAVLAPVFGNVTAAEARLLRAIPDVTLGLVAARPARAHHLDRIEALLGRAALEALLSTHAPRSSASERDLLASYLFESPALLADPARPRSAGPDGTVHLEEHAGIESEVEATADWVAREVLDGTPLEEIAVLLPELDSLAGLVSQRLARLPWHEGPLPVHVAGGLPLTGTTSGARALAVVRALRAHLAGEALAEVLPALRPIGDDARHLSHGGAMDLAWSLGTAGGNHAHPEGALEWSARAIRREPDLAAQLERMRAAGDESPGFARKARDLERLLADLRAVKPALEALVDVARLVVSGAPLGEVWPALRALFEKWLLQPGDGPRVQALLDERLAGIASDPACAALDLDDALRLIEDAIVATRTTNGRFGEPAVYVGTVRDAVGLPFRAVRVIGLAEGHLPALPREDPVIPDRLRAGLRTVGVDGKEIAPPAAADRALEALHALDTVIRDAGLRVALSLSRLDTLRSQREPSSVILEAAAALGRPNATTGEPGAVVPDARALRRDAFVPARRATLEFRRGVPLGETAWHDGVAAGALAIPARWRGTASLDLERIALLRDAEGPGPLDGILGAAAASCSVPGLTPARPISPSALQTLLACPHLFLLGNVLGFDEPVSAPRPREIGQPAYGALFHLVAEGFFRVHGASFCARQDTLEQWRAEADVTVERVFAAFLEQYPLVGDVVRGRERERLRGDLYDLLEHEWAGATTPLRFIGVERPFGVPVPVELPTGGRSLFVRGQIDRIDVDGPSTLVRDLKTGRAHPRVGKKAAPDPALDIQIAVYGLVAQHLATEWQIPPRISAAYAYVGRGADERAWRDDFHKVLEPAAREWLAIAAELLAERSFPRTPDVDDCTYCCFRPVCGDGVYARAARLLAAGTGALARFRAIKNVKLEPED